MTDRLRTASTLSLLFFIPFFFGVSNAQNTGLLKLFGEKPEGKRENVYVRKEAPEGAFPFYVSLRRANLNLHYCAGTLISPKYVLTSASCMDSDTFGYGVSNATALVGAYHLDFEPEDEISENGKPEKEMRHPTCGPLMVNISKVHVPKAYSNGTDIRRPYNAQYDIAIVQLEKASSANWSAIPLEVPDDCCDDDVDFVSAGLGRAEEAGPYSTSLEMAAFPFMPYNECSEFFEESDSEFLGKNTQNMSRASSICIRGDGEYCQPDWGSGLFRWMGDDKPPVLVGVASRATRECSYGDPYVYTNISFHMEWILSIDGVLEDITGSVRKVSPCGKMRPTAKIFSAASALPGQHPYAVSVRPDGTLHQCNGVLIGPRHVLTSGSCVDPRYQSNPYKMTAYIGGVAVNPKDDISDSEVISVTDTIFHHSYSRRPPRNVNLALLVLEHDSINKPIRLPYLNRKCCRNDTSLRVVGWGSRSMVDAFSPALQTGVVRFITKKECKEHYDVQNLNRVSICAGGSETGEGSSLCRGDDGTPLILTGGAEDILIGIGFANTSGGCSNTQPAEFLKIAFFLKWIKKKNGTS